MPEIPTIGDALSTWLEEQRRVQNAPGTLSLCPFCGVPRQKRSDYIRCTPCATNWLDGEDITKDPRIERKTAYLKSVRENDTNTSKRG